MRIALRSIGMESATDAVHGAGYTMHDISKVQDLDSLPFSMTYQVAQSHISNPILSRIMHSTRPHRLPLGTFKNHGNSCISCMPPQKADLTITIKTLPLGRNPYKTL